jgi:NAD(P)-dependent dehydrogenase (short-subunit alcohol dehydrogenase family)
VTLGGRVAVVTGGTRGLGGDVATALEERGVRVARVGRSADRFRCDVSRADEVAELAHRVRSELGPPTILVNAAAVFGPLEPITRVDPRRWIETVEIGAFGAFLTCNAFAAGMVEEGWGRIVNITSAASLHPPGPMASAYSVAKAALNQLTRHLASELEGTGVTANVIHPGDVMTDMWAEIRDTAASLGAAAAPFTEWAEWVAETGGDPPVKAVELVLDILQSDVNGRFLWIEDPLQAPIPSWGDDEHVQPWRK